MIKKRVIPYFLLMAFPMGLGAGAASWLKLPKLPLPEVIAAWKITDEKSTPEIEAAPAENEPEWSHRVPDFAAMHPLVVGAFSLLLCTGILLAADKPRKACPLPQDL